MKRLVICCDGTWNKPENENVTNIEKIARTIEVNRRKTGGVQQLVQYIGGVGTNWYWTDRVLGGALGLGLFGHVTTAYRFLALNYEPGDQRSSSSGSAVAPTPPAASSACSPRWVC